MVLPLVAAGASAAFSFLGAGMSYNADKAKYKAQLGWQKYTNKMTDLSHGVSQNTITTNELLKADALVNQAVQLRKESMFTRGQVETASAAAGVKGRSVNLAIRSVVGNSAAREAERQEAFRTTMLGIDTERKSAAMSAAMQKDYSYIPKPNAASYYLNAATKSLNTAGSFGLFK